ncbi:type IV toxin-antitoxin system YeeU family antitoxin [Kluyvera ascorbata]|uniref:type IV toxin-antitoxin system YeeU family antitoxin n=1 Tax=Kluyvera ascorbata TaxID=51288 RepID=UPI0009079314|nr:type IV toxin-antitoxin system YeeU family antitoxin [Kluyvera ascorbata]BCA38775.1 antitoxin [Kluyvera ascorbata]STW98025.1 Putative antitoxin YfjZ [Kluyvera ascorbata]HBL0735504.1 type IV toxin-antitoxin system YeeU family antitoxin [Kluyvera ascorbata]
MPSTILPLNWGLYRDVLPRFGARLVLENRRLHYLADRSSINGTFSEADARQLDQVFPLILRELELMLTTGRLHPARAQCVTLHHNSLTCEADTLGSCGYLYLVIYPTPP